MKKLDICVDLKCQLDLCPAHKLTFWAKMMFEIKKVVDVHFHLMECIQIDKSYKKEKKKEWMDEEKKERKMTIGSNL